MGAKDDATISLDDAVVPDSVGESEEQDSLVGTTLAGVYRIDEVLADGGMSRLYRGYHTRLELPVAIKIAHASRSAKPSSVQRAEREARVMASIRTENIVRVLDLCETTDGRPCMVTELLEGMDLAQHLREEQRLSVPRSVEVALDICEGVGLAHKRGLVHRDLKPSNVFLAREDDAREVVKVLDFGVAKLEGGETLTHEGAFLGTPSFMAPEQAAAASDVDERADVYAIGAILYNMLAGAPPYGDLSGHKTIMALLKGPPPPLASVAPDLPSAIIDVVEAAMAFDPQERIATVDALRQRLEAFVSAPAPKPPARWMRSKAVLASFVAAIVFGAWAAALTGTILLSALQDPVDWVRYLVPSIAGGAALLLLITLLRAVASAWRDRPRLEKLTRRILRSGAIAMVVHAVLVVGLGAVHGFTLDASPMLPAEHLVALAAAGITFVVVATRKLR